MIVGKRQRVQPENSTLSGCPMTVPQRRCSIVSAQSKHSDRRAANMEDRSGLLLQTERLTLRPITVDDAEFYMNLMNTPTWLEFIGDRNVRDIHTARRYVEERMVSQWKQLGYGNFVVQLRETQQDIGAVGIFTRPGLAHSDLGFAFFPEFEGKGFATEASKLVLSQAKNTFGIALLQAITSHTNLSCQRLLSRLGFEPQGDTVLPGESTPVLLYSLQL